MNKNTSDRCAHVIAPMLAAGEQIELIEAVQIGKVSAKSQIAASAVVGLATAGTVIVALRPQAYFLVLTNQRFVLIDNLRGRVGQVVSAVPRSSVSAGPLRSKGLTLGMDVTIDGTELWFSWGRVQGKMAQPLRPDSRPLPLRRQLVSSSAAGACGRTGTVPLSPPRNLAGVGETAVGQDRHGLARVQLRGDRDVTGEINGD